MLKLRFKVGMLYLPLPHHQRGTGLCVEMLSASVCLQLSYGAPSA